MTKAERDALMKELDGIDERLYPKKGESPPTKESQRLRDLWYRKLESYYQGLPRVVMSVCPYCGELLRRSFDPFGLDGPWWGGERLVEVREPKACKHFKVMLGAFQVRRRAPAEATHNVLAGPEVPFVVPNLLELPGMIAVVSEVRLETGDVAYPIAYFSAEEIREIDLHAPWLQSEHWFHDEHGNSCWNISNDEWSFDLEAYLEDGRLRWADLDTARPRVCTAEETACPYADLEGTRRPQLLYDGEKTFLDLPTGEIVCPF